MSNFWREIQNGLSDCKYWGISEKILRKEYFNIYVVLQVIFLANVFEKVFGGTFKMDHQIVSTGEFQKRS